MANATQTQTREIHPNDLIHGDHVWSQGHLWEVVETRQDPWGNRGPNNERRPRLILAMDAKLPPELLEVTP